MPPGCCRPARAVNDAVRYAIDEAGGGDRKLKQMDVHRHLPLWNMKFYHEEHGAPHEDCWTSKHEPDRLTVSVQP